MARNLADSGELPLRIERAGSGNINLTLRVTLRSRSFILKQRRWVEEYNQIAAPWERTVIEGQFYQAVRSVRAVSSWMPELVALDRHSHGLVLYCSTAPQDFESVLLDRLMR